MSGRGTRTRTDLEWTIARGIAGFRWLSLSWAAVVLVLTRAKVDGPVLGVALLGAALAVTVATTEASIRRRPYLFHPATVAVEVAVGGAMLVLDGSVYGESHSQSLGSAWPVAGVLMAALVAGATAGIVAGATLGAARWLGDAIAGFEASNLGLLSSGVLFTIAGGAAGTAVTRLRRSEATIAEARARESVARTLHDGVLQTLAVVQRRSSDPELAALAREQELELRAFLAGDRTTARPGSSGSGATGDVVLEPGIGPALRSVAAKLERRDGLRVEVLVLDDPGPSVAPTTVDAIAGAVGEALTNAHKHGAAAKATVFVEVDERGGLFCSVKDDGRGFDPATTSFGTGITGSIVGRLADVGGTAEVHARPGSGAEVRLRAPLR